MGTLASNRKGYITGAQASGYQDAHGATTGVASDSQTGDVNTAIQYFFSTGRGGGVHRFTRTFLHFDTSGISAGVSGMSLVLTVTAGSANVIGIKHTAGTSNGSELANDDFNNIDRSTIYTASTSWASSGQVTMTFTAAGLAAVIAQNDFNIALIGIEDQNAEEESPLEESGDISRGIAFGSAINLTYTDPASGYTHKINGLASASIGKVNTVATGSIGKINTVD